MRHLVTATIAFYVVWGNVDILGPKQKTFTGILFMDSKKIILNGLEHVKHNRKR